MAAETGSGRCKFSDFIDTEFVIDANKDRGRGQHPQLCLVKSFATRSSFLSSPQRQHQQQFRRIIQERLKYSLKIVANIVNSGQLINQGNPDVYLLNAKEDSTGEDFRWVDISRIDLSPPPYDHRDKKIFLLMGAAGSGKSTLTNEWSTTSGPFSGKILSALSASTKTI
jgi:hypothetical protein